MSGPVSKEKHLSSLTFPFQSPDGDSLCPDVVVVVLSAMVAHAFQSPDGDSLCPDLSGCPYWSFLGGHVSVP